MRRVTTIAALSAAVALTFAGCAKQDEGSSSSSGDSGSGTSSTQDI